MERVSVVNWTVLCVYILLLEVVSPVPHHDGSNGEGKQISAGAKLRRKRNSGSDIYENLQRDGLAVLLINSLKDTPWADILANDGRRPARSDQVRSPSTESGGKHPALSFIPRLGRESGEEILVGPEENRWLQDPVMSEEALYQRSPPFAPRLGRRSPFYPRLGRDNDKMPFS